MGPKRPLLTPFEQRVSPGQATPSLEARRCGSKAMGHFLKYARSAYGQGMRLGGWLHQAGKVCSDNPARQAGPTSRVHGGACLRE